MLFRFTKQQSIKTVSKRPFLLSLLLTLALFAAACTPAVSSVAPAEPQPYTFYLDAQNMLSPQNSFTPLDPQTLNETKNGRPLPSEIQMISADGSTGLGTSYPSGRATRNPDNIWIHIHDLAGVAERQRFHPPEPGLVTGLSANGSRLLLQADADPHAASTYPPTVDWYVLDSADGTVITHIEDSDNACFRQHAIFDPAGERIYCVVDPALDGAEKPVPMRIVAYDVTSGARAREVVLKNVRIGAENIERGDEFVSTLLEPGTALSPDGQQIAVVHADAGKITLLNAHNLTVAKSFTLKQGLSPRDWFGFAPQTAHAKGAVEGMIRQAEFSADGRFLYIFSQELRLEEKDAPAERGLWLVDLDQEQLLAKALPEYQVQWLRPAPDGSVYAF
ncbi:MAG: hypothetical protein R3293_27695, partial [Candidatus Promineifilaceae bacterium]|nr:hypothetical protein [Candidatus Promineifilaceae bacterium]